MQNDILTTANFEAVLAWIDGKAESEPAVAGMFVSRLNEKYITRKLNGADAETSSSEQKPRRSKLALSSIVAEDYLNKISEENKVVSHLQAVSSMNEPSSSSTIPDGNIKEEVKDENAAPAPATVGDEVDDLPPAGDEPVLSEREKARMLPRSEDGFIELGMDSVNIAAALTWWWTGLDKELNRNKKWSVNLVMLALYLAYGHLLAQRNTRLTAEHPQMWRYGVAFARAYNKMAEWESNGQACASHLEKEHPTLAEMMKSILAAIAEKGITKTSEKHRSGGTPWQRTYKKYPDQWSTVIDDKLIHDWFAEKIEKKNSI